MQKTIHALHRLLPVLFSATLIACGSSQSSSTGASGSEDLSAQLNAADNDSADDNQLASDISSDRTVIVVRADDDAVDTSDDTSLGQANADDTQPEQADDSAVIADNQTLDNADQSGAADALDDGESPLPSDPDTTAADEVDPVTVDDDVADGDTALEQDDDATAAAQDDITDTVDTAQDNGTVTADSEHDDDTSTTDAAQDDSADTIDAAQDSDADTGDTVQDDPTDATDQSDAEPADAADETNIDDADDPEQDEPQPTLQFDGFASGTSQIVLDCANELPCTVSDADGAVSVVVENVYRHPNTRRLAIAMTFTTNRDTTLRWDNGTTASDNIATTYYGTDRELRSFLQHDRDNDVVTLLAGTTLSMVQHFRERPLDAAVSMAHFDTGYTEAGVRTALRFSNLPLDPVLGDIVDCNFQMPCAWVSIDESYSVNVVKASGLWQSGRLRIDFEVGAFIGLDLHVYSSDSVVGNDGSVFKPRTHSLGSTSDYREFTETLVERGVLRGYQDFRINAERLATSLLQVKLGMSSVHAPAAGSPVFKNLPLE